MTKPSARLQAAAAGAGYTTECVTSPATSTEPVESARGLGDKLPLNTQLECVAAMQRLLAQFAKTELVATSYELDNTSDVFVWERVTLTTPRHEIKFSLRTHVIDPTVRWPITK